MFLRRTTPRDGINPIERAAINLFDDQWPALGLHANSRLWKLIIVGYAVITDNGKWIVGNGPYRKGIESWLAIRSRANTAINWWTPMQEFALGAAR